MEKMKIGRMKTAEKKDRIIEVRKDVITLLGEHKDKKFNSEEIADDIGLEIGAKTLKGDTKKPPKVASITDDSNILTKALNELVDEKKIRSEYNPSEERKSYLLEQLDISYVREKLHMAVRTLVSGSDNIQDRLLNAVGGNNFVGLKGEWACKETDERKKFLELMGKLEGEELFDDEGRMETIISRMPEEEASELAERIVDIYHGICLQ